MKSNKKLGHSLGFGGGLVVAFVIVGFMFKAFIFSAPELEEVQEVKPVVMAAEREVIDSSDVSKEPLKQVMGKTKFQKEIQADSGELSLVKEHKPAAVGDSLKEKPMQAPAALLPLKESVDKQVKILESKVPEKKAIKVEAPVSKEVSKKKEDLPSVISKATKELTILEKNHV